MAGLVTSALLGRRFCVGMLLCGRDLSLGIFIRGCTIFTKPFNIDKSPCDFIHILLVISSCSPEWVGFDEKFPINSSPDFAYKFLLASPSQTTNQQRIKVLTRFLIFRSRGLEDKGTITCACLFGRLVQSNQQHCVLKDCWANADWLNDIDIHSLLNSRPPDPIQDAEEQTIFGKEDSKAIFSNCAPAIDSWNDTTYLPGIPIIYEWERVRQTLPSCGADGSISLSLQNDTTFNIISRVETRFQLKYEPRIHIRTLSRTCAVPITLFSCRREFLGGFMGTIVGHYNGLRKGILHCDVSESNTWLRVRSFSSDDVVPAWDGENFVQRAGVLGDWGSAQDLRSPATMQKRQGFVTGTIPFMATKLLRPDGHEGKISHSVHHDLESFFWVLWSITLNAAGPYGKLRKWLNGQDGFPTPFTLSSEPEIPTSDGHIPVTNKPAVQSFSGSVRYAADGNRIPVPAWATTEQYPCTFEEVLTWRMGAKEDAVCDSLSPYFSNGQGGEEFLDGMQRLFQYFDTSHTSKDHITHKIFVDILQQMKDAINPADDIASNEQRLPADHSVREEQHIC
ncbi:hypothetical protein EV363DRAFT_1356298 [Boletus edulis]|nr:hypothetical protein EV363DRAFT_1356298 [Boletus edulis]